MLSMPFSFFFFFFLPVEVGREDCCSLLIDSTVKFNKPIKAAGGLPGYVPIEKERGSHSLRHGFLERACKK
jgi:hypothetical protein